MQAPRENTPRKRSWLSTFKFLERHPARFHQTAAACPQFDWDFEECCTWQRFFVVLTPASSDTYARHILSAWKACGVDVRMEMLDITEAGFEVYLHRCSCSQWNHYLICKHSYAQAKEDGLVVGLPQTLEDRTALLHSDAGRSAKAKGGGARGYV